MFAIAGNVPRLVVAGPEVDRAHEPTLAALAVDFDVCIVGDAYPTWSAAYADTHRACNYLEYGALFAAVSDLMGEVPFCGVISLDPRVDPVLGRVARALGLVDPMESGLSALLRSGSLGTSSSSSLPCTPDGPAARAVGDLAMTAFDPVSQRLMRWPAPVS